MDVYRKENKLVLWVKDKDGNKRLEHDFSMEFYLHKDATWHLQRMGIRYRLVEKETYLRRKQEVLAVRAPELSKFERFVRRIEKFTKHKIPFYTADIPPEQIFLYYNDLFPCSKVSIRNGKIRSVHNAEPVPIQSVNLRVYGKPITKIVIDGEVIEGEERQILKKFSEFFARRDPDAIIMKYGFRQIPLLQERLRHHKIPCPLNRWDDYTLKTKGGRSYWSYGNVRYQDFAVRLRGRFLIDTTTHVGAECEIDGIVEMAQLSGTLLQQVASRSFGAAFQNRLVREMVTRDILVPFKEKPIDPPLSMLEMLKCDRAGHTYDPLVGFHKNVAEIDFTSMFPWLIYNHNIGADCLLSDSGKKTNIPTTPFSTTLEYRSLVGTALKPFIDRRMYYKKNPTSINKKRAKGLKWVLVSCYGYLRFREFKLGLPSTHMCICAYARETILKVIKMAENRGFEVVHAIVDSMYIKKKGMTRREVEDFCKDIEYETGIPIWFEGIFKWIVFLPSVVDRDRALPSTYYGVFEHGDIKARGIEVRRSSSPPIVQTFQETVLQRMSSCNSVEEIRDLIPGVVKTLRNLIKTLHTLPEQSLIVKIGVSKDKYKNDIPQKAITERLKERGIDVQPGMNIYFIYSMQGPELPDEYHRKPDVEKYKDLLVRSLFSILQPFGLSKNSIQQNLEPEVQLKLLNRSTGIRGTMKISNNVVH